VSDRPPGGAPGAEAGPTWFLDGSACPSWCTQGHLRALHEGNSLEASAEHVGRGTSGHLPEMRSHGDGRLTRPGGGSWELVTVQEPMADGFGHRMEPAVEFELRDGRPQQARVRLTSGEARVLAAQLLHAADQLDLEG
jgi:hypothetical protein